MNKTNFEFYSVSPELMARILASAYMAGLEASKGFDHDEIDEIILNEELTGDIVKRYLDILNLIHPTYLGKAD